MPACSSKLNARYFVFITGRFLRFSLGVVCRCPLQQHDLFHRVPGSPGNKSITHHYHLHNEELLFRQVRCYLLLRFHLLRLHLLDLPGKNGLRLRGRVDAVCLDRDDEVATILQEKLRIQRNNPSLSKIA